jgi:hypothetical protein
MTMAASETLHPVLQKIRRRRIVISIGTQLNFRDVRDTTGVTGVNANEGALERGREIRVSSSSSDFALRAAHSSRT